MEARSKCIVSGGVWLMPLELCNAGETEEGASPVCLLHPGASHIVAGTKVKSNSNTVRLESVRFNDKPVGVDIRGVLTIEGPNPSSLLAYVHDGETALPVTTSSDDDLELRFRVCSRSFFGPRVWLRVNASPRPVDYQLRPGL
jgi:hypothetical protein